MDLYHALSSIEECVITNVRIANELLLIPQRALCINSIRKLNSFALFKFVAVFFHASSQGMKKGKKIGRKTGILKNIFSTLKYGSVINGGGPAPPDRVCVLIHAPMQHVLYNSYGASLIPPLTYLLPLSFAQFYDRLLIQSNTLKFIAYFRSGDAAAERNEIIYHFSMCQCIQVPHF